MGRLGLGVGVKTNIVMLCSYEIGHSGSFRVRVGVKTNLPINLKLSYRYRERDCVDGTVASSATVPSRLDGTVATVLTVP